MSRCAVEFTGGLTSHPPASPKRNEQIKRRELAKLRSGLGCKSTLGRGKVLEFLWVVKSFGHLPSRFSCTFGPVITFVFLRLCSVDSIGNTGGRQTSNSCFAAGCWLNHGGVRHSTGQKSWCLGCWISAGVEVFPVAGYNDDVQVYDVGQALCQLGIEAPDGGQRN